MPIATMSARPRKAAYSVAETAALCGVSRTRFYDHVESGVMPPPVYSLRNRRPHYPADLAALCVRIKETNIGFDGQFVMFYDRRPNQSTSLPDSKPARHGPKAGPPDPLMLEMLDTLRAMGVRTPDDQLQEAIRKRCPSGVAEEAFEADLRAIFDALRCPEAV